MKPVFWALCGSLLFLTMASGQIAHAADSKVVVEQFEGSGSDQLRKKVRDIIGGIAGVSVVTDKKLAAAEADLGLMQASDAYEAVAKQLGAIAFVSGKVKGKRAVTATVTVRDAAGKVMGTASVKGKNERDLLGNADRALSGRLADLLGKSGGAAPVAAAESKPAAKETPAEKPKAAAREEKAKPAKAAAAPPPAEDEDEDSESDGAMAGAVSASLDTDEPSRAPDDAWTGFDLFAGAMMYQREFTYNQLAKGDLVEQNGPAAAIAVGADYYFLGFLGLTAGGEFTVATSATQDGVDGSFPISSTFFYVGPKLKLNLSALELFGQVTYGQHSFEVGANGDTDSNVASVGYSQVRTHGGARLDLGAFALLGSAGFLYVLDTGDIASAFPGTSAMGVEANIGAAIGLPFVAQGFEARASLVYRQYALTMDSRAGDDNIAGGATDSYLGVTIGAAFHSRP